jgi:secreted PhoX family phosphatase
VHTNIFTQTAMAVALTAAFAAPCAAGDQDGTLLDPGAAYEDFLKDESEKLFGFEDPLEQSATEANVIDRNVAKAKDRQLLADGLKAKFVTRAVGGNGDMVSFWPDDLHYTHLIVCNELGRSGVVTTAFGTHAGQNPGVQRVNVKTGKAETILYGMDRCDGLRTTPWGTILATEEAGESGGAYEIIDPLGTTGHWVADRGVQGGPAEIRVAIGSATASKNVIKRTALVAQSWEGLEVLDNGVVIGGDELRPSLDNDGGAIFRFVPSTFFACDGTPVRPGQTCENPISRLDQSPFVAGTNYALATVCSGTDDFGQGCETGRGLWVEVNAATARVDANERGAAGYCRPEDLHVDRTYGVYAGGEGIRLCWTNTCGGGFGEALCAVENAMGANRGVFDQNFGWKLLSADGTNPAEVLVTRFVGGDEALNSHDNLDFQPVTGNVYVIEDNDFGDVWACLPDGADRNFETDGCVRMLSIRDPDAEPSGFIFDGTGKTAYYHVQHGQQFDELRDFESNPIDGRTDDLIKITGFKLGDKDDKGSGQGKGQPGLDD